MLTTKKKIDSLYHKNFYVKMNRKINVARKNNKKKKAHTFNQICFAAVLFCGFSVASNNGTGGRTRFVENVAEAVAVAVVATAEATAGAVAAAEAGVKDEDVDVAEAAAVVGAVAVAEAAAEAEVTI